MDRQCGFMGWMMSALSTPLWLRRRAELSPDRIAFVDTVGDRGNVSFLAFYRRVCQTARLLQRLGVVTGERVAVLSHNRLAYLELLFACAELGAILQTLNWRLTPRELAAIITDASPRVLACEAEFVPIADGLPTPHPTLLSLDSQAGGRTKIDVCTSLSYEPLDVPPPQPDDPWVICYTGGTTGLPKGALLTHRNIHANAINTIVSWGLRPDDLAILNAPLFHTGGLNVFTTPLLYLGGTSILCQRFCVDQVFDLLEQHPVSLFFGVPTMFQTMRDHPRFAEARLERLRLCISGGAPCPMPIYEAYWQRGVAFRSGYGLTEAGPNNFWLPDADVRRKPGSVGVPLMHVQTKTVLAGGQPCPPGGVGELWIRGPHVFAGYWRRPEASAQCLQDGWLHTGDLATVDEDGYTTIVGRLKDVIISGGENIYPAEVESVLAGHPAIAEVALIGVPDPKWGEVGRAVVALHPGERLDATELVLWAGDRLARYKLPRSVLFVDVLPRTGAGKVDKRALAELATHADTN